MKQRLKARMDSAAPGSGGKGPRITNQSCRTGKDGGDHGGHEPPGAWKPRKRTGADRRIAGQALRQLQRVAPTAVAVLWKVMRDPKASASSQVRAAEIVLATIMQAAVKEDLEWEVAQLKAERSAVQGMPAPQGT